MNNEQFPLFPTLEWSAWQPYSFVTAAHPGCLQKAGSFIFLWAPKLHLVPTGINPFFPNTIWRTGLENQPWHLWVALHSICCRNPRQFSPLFPSFLLFFFVSFFPDKMGVDSGFIGNVLHIHFLGGAMGHNSTRTCVRSVLVAVHKHRIVLPMCETWAGK